MNDADQEELYDRLERLAEYETVSAFALAYYELIADFLGGEGRGCQAMRLRLLEFLEIVERYHRALDIFASEDQVTLGNVRSAAEKRDIALKVLLEQLARDGTVGSAEIGRLLLCAECYYQLGAVDRVVERLEAALEAGADHPLVQFALGYNRYELATQAFTRYSPESGQREIEDEDRFRLACLSAVSALQKGLSGEAFDGQIHWWIGNVLEAAGFGEAARASFDKATEILGEAEVAGVGDAARPKAVFGESEPATARAGREPITEDEVRRVGMLLRRSYSASDIMNG
ncbi:MAG: hypothetical protein AB7Y46_18165 [Armatimonadota bacterium]